MVGPLRGPRLQDKVSGHLVGRDQAVCVSHLCQRHHSVEDRTYSAGLDLLKRPTQIVYVAGERPADLSLSKEELTDIEGDLGAAEKADSNDDPLRSCQVDQLREQITGDLIDDDIDTGATGPGPHALGQIVRSASCS